MAVLSLVRDWRYSGGDMALCGGITKSRFIRFVTSPEQCSKSLRVSPHPYQGLRHGKVGNHLQIKGINCLETAMLKYSLWPCPRGKNDSKLIKQDQRFKCYDESQLQ